MKYFLSIIIILIIPGLIFTACTSGAEAVSGDAERSTGQSAEDSSVTDNTDIPDVPLLSPEDIEYVGAFRLPGDGERPDTFEYGGSTLTFNPNGDPDGPDDGFTGSLYIMGHPRLAYGELPDGNKVAEVSIPIPVVLQSVESLNTAGFLQQFSNVAEGYFSTLDEIPRTAMQYFEHPKSGQQSIQLAWGAHFQEETETMIPSHALFNTDLSNPDLQGTWYIGDQSLYSTNGYLLDIPVSWADKYLDGFYLGTGRYRDGGWSGMGPSLFAYSPWIDEDGTQLYQDGERLEEKTLLLYENSRNTDDIERCLKDYQHADEWSGAVWVTTESGKAAVIFVGTKGTGDKYWYGFINPVNPEDPCVEEELLGQFPLCRNSDGSICTGQDLAECEGHTSGRGWWSSSFSAQFILYDPSVLTRVAAGQLDPWEPQPYDFLEIDSHLFFNPSGIEEEMIGSGNQRLNRLGGATFDRTNGILYVLELFADEARPVVHVWKIH